MGAVPPPTPTFFNDLDLDLDKRNVYPLHCSQITLT